MRAAKALILRFRLNNGQLIREDNSALNKSFTYTYDLAGNITSRKTYAFTTGTLVTATKTETLGYTDSSWGDRLTSLFGTRNGNQNSGLRRHLILSESVSCEDL